MAEIDEEIKELIEEADKKEQDKINTIGKRLFFKKFKKHIMSGSVRFYNDDGMFKPWSYAYKYASQNRNDITKYDCYFKEHKDEYITFYLGEGPAITEIRKIRENQHAFEDKRLRSDGYTD